MCTVHNNNVHRAIKQKDDSLFYKFKYPPRVSPHLNSILGEKQIEDEISFCM